MQKERQRSGPITVVLLCIVVMRSYISEKKHVRLWHSKGFKYKSVAMWEVCGSAYHGGSNKKQRACPS